MVGTINHLQLIIQNIGWARAPAPPLLRACMYHVLTYLGPSIRQDDLKHNKQNT